MAAAGPDHDEKTDEHRSTQMPSQRTTNAVDPQPSPVAGKRLASIDAYRGIVMFLMLAEVLRLNELYKKFPGNAFFEWLRFHTSHVEWVGCSLHDMIQPSFTFLVGVSLPFSIASRLRRVPVDARC